MKYVLAIDIGASSGRHMLGWIEDECIYIKEIYRFKNHIEHRNHHDIWRIDELLKHIKIGMRECAKLDKIPDSVAIDTWACDFILCDFDGNLLGDCVSYRDQRCDGIMEETFQIMKKEDLYEKTGIQFQKFNTLYQLLALRKEQPEQLSQAEHFLMVPDYLNYVLTGTYANEYTNATTTQLVDATTQDWNDEILQAFHLPKKMFHPIQKPGSVLGRLRKEVVEEIGYDCDVLLCAGHDTGSAFGAVTGNQDILISSGTWSLVGTLLPKPYCTRESMLQNFSNEGGCNQDIRYLKNIMGMWMIQEVQRQYDFHYSFTDMMIMARKERANNFLIDVEDDRFLHPQDMILEIQLACLEHKRKIPKTPGEITWCIYQSLAHAYHKVILEVEDTLQTKFSRVHIFGGGCQNTLLNEVVEEITHKQVITGPVEATAIGNMMVQFKHVYGIDTSAIQNYTIKEVMYHE